MITTTSANPPMEENTDSGAEEVVEVTRRVFRNPLDTPIHMIANRFGGSKPKEVERFLKFAIVGISGALVDFGLVIVLQAYLLPPNQRMLGEIDLNVALVSLIAFTTAVLNNFLWTRLWVYPDSRSRSLRRQLAIFTFVSFVGGVARTVWVTLSHSLIGALALPPLLPFIQIIRKGYIPGPNAPEKLGTLIATMIAMVVIMLWNFFANRYWTYNDVK